MYNSAENMVILKNGEVRGNFVVKLSAFHDVESVCS